MARLLTAKFESRSISAEGLTSSGSPTFDTENQFDGTVCLKCPKGGENRFTRTQTVATGTTAYVRCAIRFGGSVTPSATMIFQRFFGSVALTELRLTTEGKIGLWNNVKGNWIFENAFTPVKDTYYLFELKTLIAAAGNATAGLKIYSATGETLYESGDKSVELNNSAIVNFGVGHFSTETNVDVYVSHAALNDSSGAAQNSYSGFAKVVELKPVEDGARSAGWLEPGGGEVNLWKALDNRPPTGVADSNIKATAGEKQIRDVVNNATDTFVATLAAYETAVGSGGGGLKAGDTVSVAQAIARGGNSTVTPRNLVVRAEANPGPDTEVTVASGSTAAGTEPTGWTTLFGTMNYAPSVTLSTKPEVRVRKGTASTNATLFDLVGLIVEYVPGVSAKSPPFAPRTARNALLRR